jgi:hypothetical protein
MPANKRPKKPYRPRVVIKPLGIKNTVKLEMPGHVGLMALGQGWLDITHLRDIGSHVCLVERVADAVGDAGMASKARRAIAIFTRCEDRYERTGRPGTTGEEMHTLRDIVSETLPWLTQQSNHHIARESQALLRAFDKAVAAA